MLHLHSTAVFTPLLLLFQLHTQLHTLYTGEVSLQDSLAAPRAESAVGGGEAGPAQGECGVRGELGGAGLLRQEPPQRGRCSRPQPRLCRHRVSGAGVGLGALQKVVHVP